MKKLFVYITILFFAGCLNEDFENTFNNSVVEPELSVPAGSVSFNINDEFVSSSPSDMPGTYGTIYYENNPYPLHVLDYYRHDSGDLNLRITNDSRQNIESITFHIVFKNSLPTDVYTQILLTNFSGGIVDSLFKEKDNSGPLKIPGGQIDVNGIVQKESVTAVDIPFGKDKIDDLQNVDLYQFTSHILTTRQGVTSVRFFEESKLQVAMGVRIKLRLGGNQL